LPAGWDLRIERWAPLFVACLTGFLGWHFGYLHLLSAGWSGPFLDKIVNATAILVAYLVTVVAILPATEDKRIIRQLKEWGYYPQLIRYIGLSLWSLFALLVLSVAASAFSYRVKMRPSFDGAYSAAWWFLLGYGISAFVRTTRLMLKLLIAH
jgi:hypothetical protein